MSIQFDTNTEIMFETRVPVMFSPLERKLGLSMQWKPWKARSIAIGANAQLIYRKADKHSPISGTLKLNKVYITEMSNNASIDSEGGERENGLVVACQDMHGYDTSFRCILNDEEFISFKDAVRLVAKEHNADNLHRSSITDHIRPVSPKRNGSHNQQSVMRRAVARAMDLYDVRSVKERTIARRGAMKYLPVLFANDLVHGSWWFTIGSILFAVTSVFILVNSFSNTLGEDDSTLDGYHYRATWILMIISGVFCTLGSMAFMRAVHEDPPMKPLFSWYHFQNDELLGSWLILLANLPVLPYSLIYLSNDRTNWVYMGALAVSVVLVIGSSLFVQACYPSEKPRRKLIQPVAFTCCYCFCSKDWMRAHLSNDWLAGCWFIFWGTLMACIVTLVLSLKAFAERNGLQSFIYGTALLETLCFAIGSAYFVTGSYPEGSLVQGDNDYWDNFQAHGPEDDSFDVHNPWHVNGAGVGGAPGGVMERDKVVGSSATGYAKLSQLPPAEDSLNLTLLENDQLHHY